MSRILTRNLVPGMVTDEDIYSLSDQLIISRGQVLTDAYIGRLVFYNVSSVRISDGKDTDEEAAEEAQEAEKEQEPVHMSPYTRRILASEEYRQFKINFDSTVVNIKGYMNNLIEKRTRIDENYLLNEIENLIVNNDSGINLFDMLHRMHSFDDPTYAHCVNVAMICNIFGKWLGFEKDELNMVTLAGLLHDIGKTKISENIISKPGKLTEEEYRIIKTHAYEGYEILKETSLNPHIINAALMHHERMDGTGYPNGLKGDEIDPCARIVAIADVYDAMTSRRVYRDALCPFKVVSIFESEGFQKYDSQYIFIFLEYIVNTYINNDVLLSDGREGTVVMINKNDLARPVVMCDGSWTDLSKDRGLSVTELL